ncbi:hypothetical protein [Reichenbachiella sp. MALMAid0571]|uniref:hypothetical protein n=1 Tax=Reichenbachiella sp. MALMAid0571 TaxID=3143939 RepID=UPI0032DFE4A1
MKYKWLYLLILLITIIGATTIFDLYRISSYQSYPMLPPDKINTQQNQIYAELSNGFLDIDWNRLDGTLEYINNQYDCSDFNLVNLIRMIYEFENEIPKNTISEIEHALMAFRYWWDEPGGNSMCYWSENHQILFASAEYLVGQKYPDVIFPKSGMSGKEHMTKARKRIMDWMEMRWNYGFTEFFSSVYYKEDIGGMINIIDLAEDQELVKKMQIIMDLLFYDVASQNIKGMFISVSGRAYERNRKGTNSAASFGGIPEYYWGSGKKMNPGLMYGMMTTKRYSPPPVLIEIAKDTNTMIIKQNNGLDISELKKEGYFGTDDRSMMMQLGMEAFSNPEVIRNSLEFVRKNNMFSNSFLTGFTTLDFTFLRLLHLEPVLTRMLNPQSNGVAIQKGNTYTYKTKDYSIYSVQNYHPGTYGSQQHVSGMNIGNSFSIFHSHPAVEKDVEAHSPSYWVGYGHLPHVAQNSNVSLAIYNLPDKKGLMEYDLLDYTHANFPKEQFDSVYVTDNYAMGKKGNTYCAFIGKNGFFFRENTTDDLIQNGKQTFWITEAGSKEEDHTFGGFCKRILNNKLTFDSQNLKVIYFSNGKEYQLTYNSDFLVNKKPINTEYDRYDSPYCKAQKKANSITFNYNGKYLHLDYHKMIRNLK